MAELSAARYRLVMLPSKTTPLALALAASTLVACRGESEPTPPTAPPAAPSPDPTAPTPPAPTPPAPTPPAPRAAATDDDRPAMRPLTPDRVEAQVPDEDAAGWEAAYAAYIDAARVSASIFEQPGPVCRLAPLEDPAGGRAPYLFTARFGDARSIQLAHGGEYIPPKGGAAAAEAYFAALGFEGTRALSRQLAGTLLHHFGLLDDRFHAAAHTWALHDAHYTEDGLPVPRFTCDDEACVYIAEAIVAGPGIPTGAGVPIERRRQRRITIAPDGKVDTETVDVGG